MFLLLHILYNPFIFSNELICGWQVNKTSIIVDASKYIEELKEKVERLNQDVATSQSSSGHDSLPMVILCRVNTTSGPYSLIKFYFGPYSFNLNN